MGYTCVHYKATITWGQHVTSCQLVMGIMCTRCNRRMLGQTKIGWGSCQTARPMPSGVPYACWSCGVCGECSAGAMAHLGRRQDSHHNPEIMYNGDMHDVSKYDDLPTTFKLRGSAICTQYLRLCWQRFPAVPRCTRSAGWL